MTNRTCLSLHALYHFALRHCAQNSKQRSAFVFPVVLSAHHPAVGNSKEIRVAAKRPYDFRERDRTVLFILRSSFGELTRESRSITLNFFYFSVCRGSEERVTRARSTNPPRRTARFFIRQISGGIETFRDCEKVSSHRENA